MNSRSVGAGLQVADVSNINQVCDGNERMNTTNDRQITANDFTASNDRMTGVKTPEKWNSQSDDYSTCNESDRLCDIDQRTTAPVQDPRNTLRFCEVLKPSTI
jgi:hypothetical protein